MAAAPLPDEFSLIARYFAPLAEGRAGAEGLTDDAAFLNLDPAQELVVTADAVVAGVHFLSQDPPALVARKALRVNLSDLAAKGARPLAYFMTAAFPPGIDEPWLAAFCAGLAADQAEYGVALMGGDTTSTPGPLTLSITALGQVPRGRAPMAARSDKLTRSALRATSAGGSCSRKCTPATTASAVTTSSWAGSRVRKAASSVSPSAPARPSASGAK